MAKRDASSEESRDLAQARSPQILAKPKLRSQIFAFAPNKWQGQWMNRQQILSRLAKRGWPVTYSTGALSVWDRSSEEWRTAPWLGQFRVHDGVHVETPGKAPPRWPRFETFDRLVIRWHAASLLRHARCSRANAIAYVCHPSFLPYASALGCRKLVYYAYDLYSMERNWSDELARMERELVLSADLIVASSPAIAKGLDCENRPECLVLPNGADSHAFAAGPQLPCPADLAAIPHPRIGYFGRLNRKVDFPMIAAIAKAQPGWHWALVGPLQTGNGAPQSDPQIAAGYNLCQQLPNVHFLGLKPHTDLPAYTGHMDVNTIAYRGDRGWWNAASPLKLHEYLATGRPVVSIDLPDFHTFSDVVTFVRETDAWEAALARALSEQSAAAVAHRRRVALANSWDERVDRLEQRLEAILA